MIFNSFNFLIVFPILFLLYYLIPAKQVKWRNGFLSLTSYILYANWKPAYALILLGVTGVTYMVAKALETASERKKIVVWGG